MLNLAVYSLLYPLQRDLFIRYLFQLICLNGNYFFIYTNVVYCYIWLSTPSCPHCLQQRNLAETIRIYASATMRVRPGFFAVDGYL